MLSPYWDFLWWENKEAMFWSFHPLADKTSNEHLPKTIFQGHTKIAQYTVHVNLELFNQLWCQLFFLTLWQISVLRWYNRWFIKMIFSSMQHFHILATLFWIFFCLFSFCRHLNHLCADVLKKWLLTFQMYVHFVDFVSCNNSRYSGTCGGVVAQINKLLVVKSGLNIVEAFVSRHPQYERMVSVTGAGLLKEQFSYVATTGVRVVQKNTVWLYCRSDGKWHCYGRILKCNWICMWKKKISKADTINSLWKTAIWKKKQDLEAMRFHSGCHFFQLCFRA